MWRHLPSGRRPHLKPEVTSTDVSDYQLSETMSIIGQCRQPYQVCHSGLVVSAEAPPVLSYVTISGVLFTASKLGGFASHCVCKVTSWRIVNRCLIDCNYRNAQACTQFLNCFILMDPQVDNVYPPPPPPGNMMLCILTLRSIGLHFAIMYFRPGFTRVQTVCFLCVCLWLFSSPTPFGRR